MPDVIIVTLAVIYYSTMVVIENEGPSRTDICTQRFFLLAKEITNEIAIRFNVATRNINNKV